MLACLLLYNLHMLTIKKKKDGIFFNTTVRINFTVPSAKIRRVEEPHSLRKCFSLAGSINVALSTDRLAITMFLYLLQ